MKIDLKAEVVTMYKLDYKEFERVVTEVYGREYEFVPDIEGSNYSDYNYKIDGDVSTYEDIELTEFRNGGDIGFMARALLNDMARANLIPTGEYLITVMW